MCAAPNAVQVIVATYDFFPLIGAREVYLDLQHCYRTLGLEERVKLVEVPAHHDYNQPMREAAYAWFNRWLGLEVDAVEAPWQPEPPERLWSTASGQVLTSLGGETVRSLNRQRATRLVPPEPALPDVAAAQRYAAAVRRRAYADSPCPHDVAGEGRADRRPFIPGTRLVSIRFS